MILPSMNATLQGLQVNRQDFQQHAGQIARWGTGAAGVDPAREMVGLMTAQRGMEAMLPVIRAEDEMLGTLIDTLA